MKKGFLTLFSFILSINMLFSQHCDKYISFEEDKTTGDKTYTANDFINIIKDGDTSLRVLTLLINHQKSMILSITTVNRIKYVDPGDEIYFTFDDSTKYTLTGNQDFNTEGAFSIYLGDFKKNDELLKLLLTKKITAVRLYCRSGVLDVDLSKSNSDELFEEINCLNKLLKRSGS
ncbi:MAG TPA: hypothetical protein VH396_04870 [Chitinophagaceae bacterium]